MLYRGILNGKIKIFIIGIIIGFIISGIGAGFTISGSRSGITRELNSRHAEEFGRATDIIGSLTDELERERGLNRELQEHNFRARELTEGLTNTADRNVRNLQDAISLIGEIRTKIQVLADFYHDSDTGINGIGDMDGD